MDGIEHTIQHFSPHRTHTLLYIYTRRVLLLLPLYIYLRVHKGSLRGLMNKLILICCINKVFSPHTYTQVLDLLCLYLFKTRAPSCRCADDGEESIIVDAMPSIYWHAYTQYLYNHFVIVVYSSHAYASP